MSDLQNLTPANTYKGLLQVGDYTNGVDSTVRSVLDGEGTASALAISTTKVGIGTTSPTQELEVNGDIVSTTLTASGAVTAGSVSTSGAVGAGSIDVSGNVVADEYALDQTGSSSSAVAIHAPTTNELAIRTNSAERLRVDSSGQVGIGTTNPNAKLEVVETSSGVQLEVRGTSSVGGQFQVANAGDDIYANLRAAGSSDDAIKLDTNGPSFFNGGNVGIGIETPFKQLHVSSDQESTKIVVDNSGIDNNTYGGWIGSNGDQTEILHLGTKFNSLYTTQMSIDSNGNVGIGTTNPSAPLEVSSTTGGVIMPRMTTTQMNAISSPTDGEMIYNTTANKFYGRANGAWVALH